MKSLPDLLRRSAERNPEAIALVHGDRRLAYGPLWARVLGFAFRLREGGLEPGGRVALLLENSPEYVIAYYGTLAAGGVVVPLNGAARATELAFQLRHSEARHLVCDGHGELEALRGQCPEVTLLRVAGEEAPGGEFMFEGMRGVDPAAIIYTSGTTGRPKGVTLSHGNLVYNTGSILAYLGLDASDAMVNVLPFHYSYGNSVLHTHLAAGARLILDRAMSYPHGVLEAMERERATGFAGVPATFALLMSRARIEEYDLAALRYVTQAGGAMAHEEIHRFTRLLPHVRFYVMYGQTEATARLAWLPPERLEEKPGSIGVAIPGVEIDIRDEQGRPVAAGEVGELWARGGNVMLGYWKEPGATAAVLEGEWLKSGDLARRDEEGFLYLVGRRSEMIKSGAHRISPAEIEEVIARLEGVREVAVAGIPDPLLGEAIKAVVVLQPGAASDRMRLLRHCREMLPAYKVPRVVEFAESLPRTASGKVKRYLLADTKGDTDVSSRAGRAGGRAAAD